MGKHIAATEAGIESMFGHMFMFHEFGRDARNWPDDGLAVTAKLFAKAQLAALEANSVR